MTAGVRTDGGPAAGRRRGRVVACGGGRGLLATVFIRGGKGYGVRMSLGTGAVRTALTRREAKLGVIFLDMRRTAAELSRLI